MQGGNKIKSHSTLYTPEKKRMKNKKKQKQGRKGKRKRKGSEKRKTGEKRNKAGYTATLVACGWAEAIFEVSGAFGQEQFSQKPQKRRKSKV